MSYRLSPVRALVLLFAAAWVGAAHAGPAAAEPSCFGDWSDAAPIVARERLRSARDVQGIAQARIGGDVVRVTLCRDASGFIYRVVVRGNDGRISNLTLSAAAESR